MEKAEGKTQDAFVRLRQRVLESDCAYTSVDCGTGLADRLAVRTTGAVTVVRRL